MIKKHKLKVTPKKCTWTAQGQLYQGNKSCFCGQIVSETPTKVPFLIIQSKNNQILQKKQQKRSDHYCAKTHPYYQRRDKTKTQSAAVLLANLNWLSFAFPTRQHIPLQTSLHLSKFLTRITKKMAEVNKTISSVVHVGTAIIIEETINIVNKLSLK